jgi:very-short-patch-repair endonuclease
MTPAEQLLWKEIRNGKMNDLKFKRQHSIGKYIVDFYCAQTRLIIELDGKVHLDKEQKQKDNSRDENLRDMDYTVLRFTNDEVINNIRSVLKQITSVPPTPLSLARRGKALRKEGRVR